LSPAGHCAASAGFAAAVYGATASLSLAVINFLAGIFIDLDHVPEFLVDTRFKESPLNMFKKEGIDTKRFFYIDCISQQIGFNREEEYENCIFLENPTQVTQIAIAINKAIDNIPGEKAVLFDSLSTLLIYNNEDVVGKFSNFIINRLRLKNVSTVLIVLESDIDKRIIKTVESFVDEVKKWYLRK